jgi:COP9 signalosome complex subunit 5
MKAFRAYPPEYNSPIQNECPDGSIQPIEQLRLEHWGSCWNRYYELEVEYYMSSVSRSIMEQLTQDYLWMRTLSSQKAEGEAAEKQMAQKLVSINKSLQPAIAAAVSNSGSASTGPSGGMRGGAAFGGRPAGGGSAASTGTSSGGSNAGKQSELCKGVQQLVDLASDELRETALENTKEQVFAAESRK